MPAVVLIACNEVIVAVGAGAGPGGGCGCGGVEGGVGAGVTGAGALPLGSDEVGASEPPQPAVVIAPNVARVDSTKSRRVMSSLFIKTKSGKTCYANRI